jgi:shikimate kinase
MERHLFLIGYRGTGKSTVGHLLAAAECRRLVDADAYLEAQAGQSIRAMFASAGEAHFRDRESAVLAELCGHEPAVIATGGGVVIRPSNRALLRAHGWCAWLTATPATIAARLAHDGTTAERRPTLTVGGVAEIEQLLAVRHPWYAECADFTIATEDRSPDAVAAAILTAWRTSWT